MKNRIKYSKLNWYYFVLTKTILITIVHVSCRISNRSFYQTYNKCDTNAIQIAFVDNLWEGEGGARVLKNNFKTYKRV